MKYLDIIIKKVTRNLWLNPDNNQITSAKTFHEK